MHLLLLKVDRLRSSLRDLTKLTSTVSTAPRSPWVRRILRWTGALSALLLIVVLALTALLLLPWVQTWVAQRLAAWASDRSGVEVRIGRFTADPFGAITLWDVHVGDLQQDTLFHVHRIRVARPRLNSDTRSVHVSSLGVEGLRFKLRIDAGDAHSNLTNLVDRLFPTTGQEAGEDWRVRCGRFLLRDVHFSYHDERVPRAPWGVDVDHTDVRGLAVEGRDLDVIGDSITTRLEHLAFTEQSGLQLLDLAGAVQVGPAGIRISGMDLHTGRSRLHGDLAMLTDSWSDHAEFIDKVRMDIDLDSSHIEFAEIAYFATDLRGIELPVTAAGRVRGTVADLKGRDLRVELGDGTRFRGRADLIGLPDIDNTFMVVDIADLRTHVRHLSQLPAPPFIEGGSVALPTEVLPLGQVAFRGNFTGFIHAFTAFGTMASDLGEVRTDISYRHDTLSDQLNLSGRLATRGFDLGALAGTSVVGAIAADLRLSLSGRSFATARAELEGVVPSIRLNGALIENIEANGVLERNMFNGALRVEDDDLVLDFKGLADLRGRWPLVDFTAELSHADLRSLGIAPRSGYHSIAAHITARGRLSPDSLRGTVEAADISYCDDLGDHDIGYIKLANAQEAGEDVLRLDATFAEAEVRGRFLPTRVVELAANMMRSVFPSLGDDIIYRHEPQNIRFNVTLREADQVLGMFVPGLSFAPGSTFTGYLNSRTFDLGLQADMPVVTYGAFRATGTRVIMDKTLDVLAFSLNSQEQRLGDSTWIANSMFTGKAYQDEVELNVGWENSTNGTSGDIALLGLVHGPSEFELDLLPSKIHLGRGDWSNDRVAHITVKGDTVTLDTLVLRNGDQLMALSGRIDRDPSEALTFRFEDVALDNITPYFGGPRITGVLGGDGELHDLYGTPYLLSYLCVDSLAVEDKAVGDVRFAADWEEGGENLELSGTLTRGPIKALDFTGGLALDERQELDMELIFDRFDLTFLDPYLPDDVSDIQGLVTGTLDVTGPLLSPEVNGDLQLVDAGLRIGFLNTLYRFTHTVKVRPDMFALDLVTVMDEEGNKARLGGTILHEGLQKWNYNIWGRMDRFMVMNTSAEDNDDFYGRAYGTGDIEVSGYEGSLEVVVNARTAQGTDIHLPVGGSTEVSAISFVQFTTDSAYAEAEEKVDLSGVSLDLNVEVTPDALFELIFDPTVGDIMRGRGLGNMRMSVDRNGSFSMLGQVEVTEGDYLFTLRNVVNKRFDVAPGGTISWFGDPFDAQLDLKALYRLRAPLYDVVPPSERSEAYRKRVPVEVVMSLRDRLLNPEIGFEVKLPSVDESVKAQVLSALSTDQEMNRQVFALIVLNRFLPPPSYVSAGSPTSGGLAAGTTGFELMSNQISNWLSQLSSGFDLGVNYRPGDRITQDELEVAVSTQLFNERLLLSTNVGVQYGAQGQDNSNTLVGDFQLEYLITDDGKLRFKAFSISNDRNLNRADQALTTQGAGVGYRREANNFWRLIGLLPERREGEPVR